MTKFLIPEMSCGHCKASIETAIKSLDPEAELEFDMAARSVVVQTDATVVAMQAALKGVGYDAATI